MLLRSVAEYIKSWDFHEAALALAAINARYNSKERVEALNPDVQTTHLIDLWRKSAEKRLPL